MSAVEWSCPFPECEWSLVSPLFAVADTVEKATRLIMDPDEATKQAVASIEAQIRNHLDSEHPGWTVEQMHRMLK